MVIDGDLGGANLHTFMGIRTPGRTLNDFIGRRYDTLDEVCIGTEQKRLRIICGASEVLTMANLKYTQKTKILQAINKIEADHVVLDLGAGTGFNTLDFFLSARHQVVVMTPQPVAIQNAYAFIRKRRLPEIEPDDQQASLTGQSGESGHESEKRYSGKNGEPSARMHCRKRSPPRMPPEWPRSSNGSVPC